MVMVFLAIVALVSMVTSYQSRTVRRASIRAHHGFEAAELCESAINEAAAQVGFREVFPTAVFNEVPPPPPPPPPEPEVPPPPEPSDLGKWLMMISQEDETGLNAKFTGYGFKFRTVVGAAAPNNRIFVAMTWPEASRPTRANNYEGSLREIQVPKTVAIAQAQKGFISMSSVKVAPLAWRRDYAGGRWQDWGVVHYKVRVEFNDGKVAIPRTMHVDRMFSLYFHFPEAGIDDPAENGASSTTLFVHYVPSYRNLRTVILRS
jgi:hypothetical protein